MRRISALLGILLAPVAARAHCPLCTTAVGGAVIGAAAFGLPIGIVAVFGGAFIASTGLWIANALKRRAKAGWVHHHWTPHLLVIASWASLVVPLHFTPNVREAASSMELIMWGSHQWGITIDWLLVGSLAGLATMYLGGWLSSVIKRRAGRVLIPFQAIVLTLALLTIEAGILWVLR